MHAARLVIVLLLILAVVVTYNPQARQQAVKAWEQVKPAVASVANSLYVTIRNIVTGNRSSRDGVNEQPAPGPGDNFERIVTMNSGVVF